MPPTPSKSSSTPVTCAGSQPSSPPIIPAAVGFRPLRKRPCRGTLLDLILKNGRHVELGGKAWRTGWNDAERRQDQELERTVPAHRWRRDHWPCSSYLSPSHPSRQAVRVSGSHGCFSLESPSMLRKRVKQAARLPLNENASSNLLTSQFAECATSPKMPLPAALGRGWHAPLSRHQGLGSVEQAPQR